MHGSSVRINYNHWKDKLSLSNRNPRHVDGQPVSLACSHHKNKAGMENHLGNCPRCCKGSAQLGMPADYTPQTPQLTDMKASRQSIVNCNLVLSVRQRTGLCPMTFLLPRGKQKGQASQPSEAPLMWACLEESSGGKNLRSFENNQTCGKERGKKSPSELTTQLILKAH